MIEPTWTIPDGLQWVDVEGYPMAYRDVGSGSVVVFVHGSLNDYRAWDHQIDAFSAKHRTLTVSLRHCYPEAWDGRGGGFSVEQHGRDLAAFIATSSSGPAHLIGHSRGGAVALEVAKHRPELVRSLVLADSGHEPHLDDETQMKRRTVVANFHRAIRTRLKKMSTETRVRLFADMLGGSGDWDARSPEELEMVRDNLATLVEEPPRPVLSADQISRLAAPVLLVTGENSPKRYRDAVDQLCAHGEISPPRIVPHAAHSMHRENPTVFNQIVLEFISELDCPPFA